MREFILIISLLVSVKSYSQNLYEATTFSDSLIVFQNDNFQSKKILPIKKYEVFLIDENEDIDSNWLKVKVPKNKLSKITDSENELFLFGFVPKSKVILIDSLPQVNGNDNLLSFHLKKTNSLNNNLRNGGIYGIYPPLDGQITVSEMYVNWKGQSIKQDSELYNDLANISYYEGNYPDAKNDSFRIYKTDEIFFIRQNCGDGEYFYKITWVIKDGLILQRLVNDL